MKRNILPIILIFLLAATNRASGQAFPSYTIHSPHQSTTLQAGTDRNGQLVYRMLYSGREIISWSRAGFELAGMHTGESVAVKNKAQSSHREKFAWPLGEQDTVTNEYNEIRLLCTAAPLQFWVVIRVFDGSMALRYEIPEQGGLTNHGAISREHTEFNFPAPFTLYQYNQESPFTPVAIDTFTKTCDLPATITGQHGFISIGEADNENYTKAELKKGSKPNSLCLAFVRDSLVRFAGAYSSPWRTVSVAKTAIGLHNYSQLYLKLAPPAQQVPDWIKPGKLIRAQLNTRSGLDCIDFAAKHDFQYILFDAGWYGAEFRSSSDPTQVIPQIDLPGVISYGKQKGIGVILYVNYVGLRAKLDTILPLYKAWGVAGLKFGFVDGLTQAGLTWLTAAMKKVYDAGFVLDIHDNYKPTGLSRTYPMLLTQEGIRGDENSPDAFHTTVLPFTRFLAGAADFTFCYPNSKFSFSKNLKVSKAHQLALTVIYFSPLQAMFWYGQPNDYTDEEEIEFFKLVPTVWNESHYLAGEMGKNIAVARRKGDAWYVGCAAGSEDWKGALAFHFLSKGKRYNATVYEDDGQGSIRKRGFTVKQGDKLPLALKGSTGQAWLIAPEK